MLNGNQYRKLLEFDYQLMDGVAKHLYDNQTFLQSSLGTIESVFGYDATLSASLRSTGAKRLTPNILMHGVQMDFVDTLLVEYDNDEGIIDLSDDIFVLSRADDYRKTPLFRRVLKPYGYDDFMIRFYRDADSGRYVFYTVFLTRRKPFTDVDIETMTLICESMAHCFNLHNRTWTLENYIKLLVDRTNYYPVGIMLVEHNNHVTFTNAIAKGYLEELGIADARLYDSFFVNELYGHYMYDRLTQSPNKPVRIKNFLFNLISTSNRTDINWNYDNLMVGMDDNMSDIIAAALGDITSCVYIVRDDTYHTKFSFSSLVTYGLTRRECEIAEYAVSGLDNRSLAEQLHISENTVKTHVANIYRKMGVTNRGELLNKLYGTEDNL